MTALNGLPSTVTVASRAATLVLPRPDHAASLYRNVTTSAAVTRYLSWRPHASDGDTRRLLAHFAKANHAGRERHWVMTTTAGEAIGVVSCWLDKPHSVEVGFCLAPRWWGQSITSQVVDRLTEGLAAMPQLYRLWATTDPENSRSARVLVKSGFAQEGVLTRHLVRPNLSAEPRASLLFGKALR